MPLTTEQRRESMARARAARKIERGAEGIDAALKPKRTAADSGSTPDASTIDWGAKATVAVTDLEAKVQVLWLEREQKLREQEGQVILYQCSECGATTRDLHPMYRTNGQVVECPNRVLLHNGELTPMDYTP